MPRQYEKVFWQLVQTAARIYINGNCFLSRSDSHRACKNVPVMSFMLLFTGNIPRGVFCERRSQKTRDISREFMRSA